MEGGNDSRGGVHVIFKIRALMLIELIIVHPVYRTETVYEKRGEDEFPEEKQVLVKEIKIRKWFHREAITSVEEYVNEKNRVCRSRSMIYDRFSSRFYITWHSVEELLQRIEKPKQPIGFNGNYIYSGQA